MAGDHYFSAQPSGELVARPLTVTLAGRELTLQTAGGVFSPGGLDVGTGVLLGHVPPPPPSGDLLDLGCGYGVIGLAVILADGAAELGGVDIVVANAGIAPQQAHEPDRDAVFADVIAVNLNGVFNTVEVTRERLIAQGRGGSIIMTSSTAGIKAVGGSSGAGIGYTASKHGVVGLMRQYAVLLAEHNIRVNSVHPTGVSTPMVIGNTALAGALEDPSNMGNSISNLLPIDILEPEEISNAVAWLASDQSRYVTGVMLPVDAGLTIK